MPRTPIWKSIADALRADISGSIFVPGDKLPTEAVLAQKFDVNRHTVRRALSALAEEGLVHARQGAGVFVTSAPTLYPIGKRVRFHQNLRAAGRTPVKRVLSCDTRPARAAEQEALNLNPKDPVHVYEGLSLADEEPIAVFRSVFPAERFPGLLTHLQDGGSVTAALRAEGLFDYLRETTHLNAKLANATQARHLRISEGSPILRTIAVNVDLEGKPVEFGRTWFAGDNVTLVLNENE